MLTPLEEENESEESSTSDITDQPDIFLFTTGQLSMDDVRKSLPPRKICDKLLYIYFSTQVLQLRMSLPCQRWNFIDRSSYSSQPQVSERGMCRDITRRNSLTPWSMSYSGKTRHPHLSSGSASSSPSCV